jgi:Spy/CpxP family protein refolding chaperone
MKAVKYFPVLFLTLILCIGVFAQQPQTPPNQPKNPKDMEHKKEMVQAMKTGFITKELDLSPEEAQKFWPIYNLYENISGTKLDPTIVQHLINNKGHFHKNSDT